MSFYNKRSRPMAARQEEGSKIESKLNQLLNKNYLFQDPTDTFGAPDDKVIQISPQKTLKIKKGQVKLQLLPYVREAAALQIKQPPQQNRLLEIIDEVRKEQGIDVESYHIPFKGELRFEVPIIKKTREQL